MKIQNYGWHFGATVDTNKLRIGATNRVSAKSWAELPDLILDLKITDHSGHERIYVFNRQKQIEFTFYENKQRIFEIKYPSLDFKIINPKTYIYECLTQALDALDQRLKIITDQFDTFKKQL